MKEIVDPWQHWHTEDNNLSLPGNHPMMKDPIFRDQATQDWRFDVADRLAIIVTAGTKAWNDLIALRPLLKYFIT